MERFRTLLLKWQVKLPAGGWEGTSHELVGELDRFAEQHRLVAFTERGCRECVE